jgi:hypothetical protein
LSFRELSLLEIRFLRFAGKRGKRLQTLTPHPEHVVT